MARGQSQAADTQLSKTNAVGDTQQQKSDQLESQLVPGYTSLMDTGYLSPEEESAATTSEMGSAMAPFGAADFEAKNNAAATHNESGVAAQEDALALEKGQTAGQTAADLQKQKMENQEAGMYGLTNLEQGNQKEAEDMYGLGPGTLNARAAGESGDQIALGWANTLLGAGTSAYRTHG